MKICNSNVKTIVFMQQLNTISFSIIVVIVIVVVVVVVIVVVVVVVVVIDVYVRGDNNC